MPRTFGRFLVLHHLKYYCVMAALLAVIAAITVRSQNTAFIVLVPLSLVSSLSVTAIVFELGFRRELETLQAYGVSLRAIATPLIAITALPMLAAYFATVPRADNVVYAALLGIASLGGLAVYFAALFSGIRKSGDANAGATCMRATLAQVAVVTVLWILLSAIRR
jgi:hypothetical protein